jgi:hypothetical protein
MLVLVFNISALNFTKLNPGPHLECVFGMQIPDANPEDENHADADTHH